GKFEGLIPRSRGATVGLGGYLHSPGGILLCHPQGIVGGTVIDDNDLLVRPGLLERRLECVTDPLLGIVSRYQNGNHRGHHNSTITSPPRYNNELSGSRLAYTSLVIPATFCHEYRSL